MSDMTINKENFSRFSKRLKKSIHDHLNVDVPLTLVATLLSNAFGKQNVHEFQSYLEQIESVNITSQDEIKKQDMVNLEHLSEIYGKKVKEIINIYLKDMSNQSLNEGILSIRLKSETFGPVIQVYILNSITNDVDFFEFLFQTTKNSARRHVEMDSRILSNKIEFKHHIHLQEIASSFLTDDIAYNKFLGEKLLQHFNLKLGEFEELGQHQFFNHCLVDVKSLGFCITNQWYVVEKYNPCFSNLVKDNFQIHNTVLNNNIAPFQEISLDGINPSLSRNHAIKEYYKHPKDKILLHVLTQLKTGKNYFDISVNFHENHCLVVAGNHQKARWREIHELHESVDQSLIKAVGYFSGPFLKDNPYSKNEPESKWFLRGYLTHLPEEYETLSDSKKHTYLSVIEEDDFMPLHNRTPKTNHIKTRKKQIKKSI
jgi:hypothetical protein